jgi:DNA mismatch repair protein MutS2
MLYPKNIEQKLGFDRIRELLVDYCISPLGRAFVEKIRFSDNFDLIQKMIRQVSEMKDILQLEADAFPAQNYIDVTQHLAKAAIEGAFLNEEECFDLKLSLRTIQACLRFFENKEPEQYPTLRELISSAFSDGQRAKGYGVMGDGVTSDEVMGDGVMGNEVMGKSKNTSSTRNSITPNPITHNPITRSPITPNPILRPLLDMLEKVIDDRGRIKDNASPELQEIRRALISETIALRKKLDSLLKTAKTNGWVGEEVSLTVRNGRMVIPIAAEHKRKIKGFVQDESDTGKTVFLEPAEILDANNEIKELESRERREIVRILMDLTHRLRPHVPVLKRAYTFLGIIDFVRPKPVWLSL